MMSNEFTFTYDATTGVLIAAALREKAEAERVEAERIARVLAAEGSAFGLTLIDQAEARAKLFEDAAEAVHAPVRAALAADMGEALRKAGVLED